MALRPTLMLLASCWALLAISQDASGDPTTWGPIAASPSSTINNHGCRKLGNDYLCQTTTRPFTNDIRDAMLSYGDQSVSIALVLAKADIAEKAPPKPRVKPRREAAREDLDDTAGGHNLRIVSVAKKYLGLGERSDRRTLIGMFSRNLDQKLDPVRTPWCAAFINAVLAEAGLPTSGSNMGASFTSYGHRVRDPKPGDIIVIRGGRNSRTHVGIYIGSETRNGSRYVKLLGGNQSNHVQVSSYPASRILSIRRAA